MSRSPVALERARRFLDKHLSEGAVGGPLSVASFSALAGVSYRTMWKAVQEFKREGRLHGNYRVTSRAPDANAAAPVAQTSPTDRVEHQLTRDLLAGAITRGQRLHSVKELTARYRTSSETLRRALFAVESQGLISRQGRHYIGLGRISPAPLSIVLLAYMEEGGEGFDLPPLERGFTDACETASAGARVSLILVALNRRNGSMVTCDTQGAVIAALPAGEHVAGYLYVLQSPGSFDHGVMRRLVGQGKPVAVLDNAGVFPRDTKAYDLGHVRIFTASAFEQPGKDVAAYVLSRGHHHAAYISPFHADSWSRERYEGARKVFAVAGEEFSLAFHAQNHSIKDQYYEDEGRIGCDGPRLEGFLSRWREKTPRWFHPEVDNLRAWLSRGLYMWGAVRAATEPLLRAALTDRRVSAWIMANDAAARIALQYCLQKKIAVPDRIAIVGLDDVEESRDLRITTYNFNFNALATAIVHYLLHPESAYWRRRKIVEIEGRMVERSTG